MFWWVITKYDPKYREKRWACLKDEWTAYSDVGSSFEGVKLSFKDYIKAEDAYVNAIILFMDLTNTKNLSVVGLESYSLPERDVHYSRDMINAFVKIKEGALLDKNLVNLIARLILRENLWCKLESTNMRVRFDDDYYMSIGCSQYSKETIRKIEELGLFVEPYKSPYHNDDDESMH